MSSTFDLSGKRAIVTGGAGDIGSAISKELRRHGAEVTIIDISSKTAARAEEIAQVPGPGEVHMIQADLSSRDGIREAFSGAMDIMRGVDILVNCAGIIRRCKAEDFSEKDWDEVLEVNLTTTFLFCQLAGREMLKQNYGRIINIASMNSFTGGVLVASYAASKSAVSMVTKSLSNEWAGRGICVNAIAPGYIATQLNTFFHGQDRPEEGKRQYDIITSRIPKGRWGVAEDIAGPAVFLASDAAEYVTGITLCVDGGLMGR